MKRLVSALCAFAASFAYDVSALPQFDFLGIAEGLVSKIEGGSVDVKLRHAKTKSGRGTKSPGKGKKGKSGKQLGSSKKEFLRSVKWNDVLRLCKMLKFPYSAFVSMLKEHGVKRGGFALIGIALEKILEFPFNQIVYPNYLEWRYPGYRVLAKAFNLGGEKAESVLKVVDKVDSIGRGFNNFVKYFDKDNPPKNLGNFSTCYDNVVFICYVMSLHYQQGGYKDKDVVTRFYEVLKRLAVPLKAKRKSCRFDKEAEKSTENDMTDINHYLKKKDENPWYEFGFLGYDEPVDQFCNISMLEEWLASAFTANSEDSKAFRKRFDDLNDDGTAKAVGITKTDNKSWVIRCDGGKLNFESTKAKVADVAGTSNVTFTIPDGKDKISGNDLLEVAFKKDG